MMWTGMLARIPAVLNQLPGAARFHSATCSCIAELGEGLDTFFLNLDFLKRRTAKLLCAGGGRAANQLLMNQNNG
jgi:hypothetical protein